MARLDVARTGLALSVFIVECRGCRLTEALRFDFMLQSGLES